MYQGISPSWSPHNPQGLRAAGEPTTSVPREANYMLGYEHHFRWDCTSKSPTEFVSELLIRVVRGNDQFCQTRNKAMRRMTLCGRNRCCATRHPPKSNSVESRHISDESTDSPEATLDVFLMSSSEKAPRRLFQRLTRVSSIPCRAGDDSFEL